MLWAMEGLGRRLSIHTIQAGLARWPCAYYDASACYVGYATGGGNACCR
jgi:hypothetical protein